MMEFIETSLEHCVLRGKNWNFICCLWFEIFLAFFFAPFPPLFLFLCKFGCYAGSEGWLQLEVDGSHGPNCTDIE